MENTIESHIEQFTEHLLDTDRSGSTVRAYTTDLRLFAKCLEGLPVNAVKSRHVIIYRDGLAKDGRKPATINRKLVSILVFFDWAVSTRLVEVNPARNVEHFPDEVSPPKCMNQSNLDRLMDTVREGNNIRDYAVFTLLLNTGIRVGELCELKVSDLDLESDFAKLSIRFGKGRKSRSVFLNDACLRVITAYLEFRESQERNSQSDYLFYSQKSNQFSTRGIRHMVKSNCLKANIKPISPHVCRHTCGKHLIDTGNSIDRVAKALGHSSIETTKIYTNPTESDMCAMFNSISL